MAFQLGLRKNRPVHIVIKDHVIRYVELKQTNPLVVQHFQERYLPTGVVKDGNIISQETLSLILEECIDEWKINKRKVCFHVPDSLVVIRKVAIPDDVRDDEVYGYLYMELGSTIHLPFEEPIFDFTIVNTTEGKKELILFATPEETVEEMSVLFEDAKVIPIAADISPLSLYRLYHAVGDSQRTGQLMIVQVDIQAVSVCVFEKQYPVFMRHIPIAVDMNEWDFPQQTKSNETVRYTGDVEELQRLLEDMYREIVRVIDFYRYTLNHGNKQVTKLYVTGDHPWMNLIVKEMTKQIRIPIATIAEDAIRTTTNNSPLPTSFHCAVGLALKGV